MQNAKLTCCTRNNKLGTILLNIETYVHGIMNNTVLPEALQGSHIIIIIVDKSIKNTPALNIAGTYIVKVAEDLNRDKEERIIGPDRVPERRKKNKGKEKKTRKGKRREEHFVVCISEERYERVVQCVGTHLSAHRLVGMF